ncbi:SDR family NAD(P)-dependent oxidoreductase [Leucobacter weissii]|uniref:SDR family NAD(P)-dependent oxidoreductase n=2 Tax=Leucobacter weissii TaxID=1983706 RepID=A0A939S9G3_9MICO|nr:SDR family NAD(P)-dependent oxidoreductase [Leucobacter weissii]MBO1900897.1 SDR family NAD(P)-dependent oxidoreductase [Leucobacter weissii]
MTGASRGIGRVAARRILTEQPRSHLVLLSRTAPHELLEEFAAIDGTVSTIHTELSSLQSVADATDEVVARARSGDLPPIHTLVCNAGVQHTNALTETIDGFESTFAVNVLANHVLVRRLQDHLHAHASLVITVSDTHFGDLRHNLGMVPGPRWQPVGTLARVGAFPKPAGTTAGRIAYSTSKLAAIYLVHEYARRLPATWRIAGYNPGFVPGTALARDADACSRFAMRRVMPLLTVTPLAASVGDAGRFLADAALGALEAPRGGYIDRSRIAPSSTASYDPQRERETWEAVEALTADFLPKTAKGDIDAHHRHHGGE